MSLSRMKIAARCAARYRAPRETLDRVAFCSDDVYAKKNAKENEGGAGRAKGGNKSPREEGGGKRARRTPREGQGEGEEGEGGRRAREGRGNGGGARRRIEGSSRNITSVLSDLHGERTLMHVTARSFRTHRQSLTSSSSAPRRSLSLSQFFSLSRSVCLRISRPTTTTTTTAMTAMSYRG